MSVEVIDNTPRLRARFNNQLDLATEIGARDFVRRGSLKAPKKKGNLSKSGDFKKLSNAKFEISWGNADVAYAAAQEAGQRTTKTGSVVKFKNYTVAGTGKDFAKNAAKEVAKKTMTYLRTAGL